MQNKKLSYEQTWDSQTPVGYKRFQISCVFTKYDLFKPTTFIQNLTYVRFRLIWHSFMSISRDRNKRLMSYRYRLKPEILSFYTIPPFIFLYSPFQQKQKMNRNVFSWVGSSGRTMQANGRTFTVKRSKPTSAKAFNLSWGNTLLETCI